MLALPLLTPKALLLTPMALLAHFFDESGPMTSEWNKETGAKFPKDGQNHILTKINGHKAMNQLAFL